MIFIRILAIRILRLTYGKGSKGGSWSRNLRALRRIEHANSRKAECRMRHAPVTLIKAMFSHIRYSSWPLKH